MSGGIYLIHSDGQLVEMNQQDYDSEDLLQGLLAQYPNLLAGDQIDNLNPRRWLLVSRERGLPSEEGGSYRWAVDHLFLDQDAVPTIVEVKRSSDTRIRREVVGQMLDYAANAVVYWPVETIRAEFEANQEDPQQLIADLLGDAETDDENFWQKAKTNLQAGRVRLVFVADEIPAELRRVVEFLNEQMDPAEVLAVEVKQYVGEGDLKALVPRILGQTAEAQRKKAGGDRVGERWDEDRFMADLESRRGADETKVAKEILSWAKEKRLDIWWGKGKQDGSFFPLLKHRAVTHWLISVWTYGRIEIQFQMMQNKPPFDAESDRLGLLRRLNDIPGIDLPRDGITRRPSIPLSLFVDRSRLNQFVEILNWMIQRIEMA
jgi:hypothetical protein